MKKINELDRKQKIALLRLVKDKLISPSELTPRTWVIEKPQDHFHFMLMSIAVRKQKEAKINAIFLDLSIKEEIENAFEALLKKREKREKKNSE